MSDVHGHTLEMISQLRKSSDKRAPRILVNFCFDLVGWTTATKISCRPIGIMPTSTDLCKWQTHVELKQYSYMPFTYAIENAMYIFCNTFHYGQV